MYSVRAEDEFIVCDIELQLSSAAQWALVSDALRLIIGQVQCIDSADHRREDRVGRRAGGIVVAIDNRFGDLGPFKPPSLVINERSRICGDDHSDANSAMIRGEDVPPERPGTARLPATRTKS